MAIDNFTSQSAFALDQAGDRLNVNVWFADGKPHSVTFYDPDRDGNVSVPFDLWARVVAAVDRTVDLHAFDGAGE